MPRRSAAFADRQAGALQDPALRQIVDEFPMTVTGKIRKVEMRAAMVELLGLEPPGD